MQERREYGPVGWGRTGEERERVRQLLVESVLRGENLVDAPMNALSAMEEKRARREERQQTDLRAAMRVVMGRPSTHERVMTERVDEITRVLAAAFSERTPIRDVLKGITAPERSAMLDRILVARELGDRAEVIARMAAFAGHSSSTDPLLVVQWEYALANAVEEGLDYDERTAALVLSLLARRDIAISFAKQGHYHPTRRDKYGRVPCVMAIARTLAKRARSDEAIRRDARAALAIYMKVDEVPPPDPTRPERDEIVALRGLAGLQSQASFFALMRAGTTYHALRPRYYDPALHTLTRRILPLLHEMRAELIADESGERACAWLHDAAAYEERFGADAPPYGWWSEGKEESDRDRLDELRRRSTPMSVETFDRRWAAMRETMARTPVDMSCGTGPSLEPFAFDGDDAVGALANHLATASGAKPTTKWLKALDAHIARLGVPRVRAALEGWIAAATDKDVPSINAEEWAPHERLGNGVFFSFSGTSVAKTAHKIVVPDADLPRVAMEVARGGHHLWERDHLSSRERDPVEIMRRALRNEYCDEMVMLGTGVAWAMSRLGGVNALERLARDGFGSIRHRYCESDKRSVKVGNAAIWALGAIGTRKAAITMGRIRRSVRDKGVSKTIDRALARAGEANGLTLDDMLEMSQADYAVGADGVRVERFGPFEVRLEIVSSRRVKLTSTDTTARTPKAKRGIVKAALEHEPEWGLADDIKRAAKDIPKLLPEAKRRMEATYRTGRDWSINDWHDRMVANHLVATLTHRLIWTFTLPDGRTIDRMWTADGLVGCDGAADDEALAGARVRLWHPLGAARKDVERWRTHLVERRIRQPFAQAFRPLYVVTDAERATATYSNRFAGHVLEQAPLVVFLRHRGWDVTSRIADDPGGEASARLPLPHHGVVAEYWLSGVGQVVRDEHAEYGAANYHYVTTDRVLFRALDADGNVGEPVPVERVPPMAFCEAMRDVDGGVGLTSIGNDRFWTDRGANAAPLPSEAVDAHAYRREWARASELAPMRHAALKRLLPALRIAERATLEERTLVVRGDLHDYGIDLGSGSVHIRDGAQRHVCIVPTPAGPEVDDYLPFEGDAGLALVLSKALMLAADRAITDPVIRRQL